MLESVEDRRSPALVLLSTQHDLSHRKIYTAVASLHLQLHHSGKLDLETEVIYLAIFQIFLYKMFCVKS